MAAGGPPGAAFDVAVIGAGAAGMMCAAVAGQRGRRVVLIDHARKLAEKIRISGGGRCNFTNLEAGPANFISDNPHFCRSALSRYTPRDFLALVARHRIAWHEKHRGQLFCDESSEEIIRMLRAECDAGGVAWRMPCTVEAVEAGADGFVLRIGSGGIRAARVVIATGGLPIPQIGASDFGLRIARQFGLGIVEPRPALVPLTFDAASWKPFVPLAGIALEVDIRTGEGRGAASFREDLLFTHRGLSGPAVLQISSYWQPGRPIVVDLAPDVDLAAELIAAKAGGRQHLSNVLAGMVPRRLAEQWLTAAHPGIGERRIADLSDKVLREVADGMKRWTLVPAGTEGYKKAEVMRGGVDTRALDQQTMEARAVPGLYFIGEVVDVTGWLGGYNFQWAWASGVACGRAV
ncbi:aminoacetone oxidase family FAD-binding enzyme [Pigmentiphaga sp. NML080357]|uniref:NAD(P)/FAD-dependent oxidoreductase n=1 Tax=Pigmentiphaga sp. NML080357 TaxID=2008675 RepID=UPI000B412C35|nr:NAD(P)/FAD-dependent oxidoreductase [Pigmentiphaga sp. NML080357]OVZ61240.1 aminoacetone oxidase family FAD-binding enzyme [Pigmentiphaga sp. NML080357]